MKFESENGNERQEVQSDNNSFEVVVINPKLAFISHIDNIMKSLICSRGVKVFVFQMLLMFCILSKLK